ncbi:hypothetical protein FLL45_13560 [Aliikangiella marina]|uniref:Uncharacterized protein n=1 Tax=Aliikangiella marina TaxID=1712262 RepID=A0A545T9K0_9GAMM|nr:hypothetical protein [Aliikangiella marina]TQV73886.1 hypothetical protein FLL45_13560 [Aliikangiella marina]
MFLKRHALWVVFALFFATAVYTHSGEKLLLSDSQLPLGKPLIWLVFLGFVTYSYYCSMRENLFKTIGKMSKLHWGKQIGIDLYLGLFISVFIIYLNEGSILVTLLWLGPIVIFGNLATLLYLALNYDALIAHFL